MGNDVMVIGAQLVPQFRNQDKLEQINAFF
jgi:hypothetical protein